MRHFKKVRKLIGIISITPFIISACASLTCNVISAGRVSEIEVNNTRSNAIDWLWLDIIYPTRFAGGGVSFQGKLVSYFIKAHLEPHEKLKVLIVSNENEASNAQQTGKVLIVEPLIIEAPFILPSNIEWGKYGKGEPPSSGWLKPQKIYEVIH